MSETRMLPKATPRSTGIPNHVQSNAARPTVGGSVNGVSASPSAGREAQRAAQKSHGIGAPTPALRPGAPGVELLANAPKRPGGVPPMVTRVALEQPPLTIDQINLLGELTHEKMTATDDENVKAACLDAIRALGILLEKTANAGPAPRAESTNVVETPVAPAVAPTATETTVVQNGGSLAQDRG